MVKIQIYPFLFRRIIMDVGMNKVKWENLFSSIMGTEITLCYFFEEMDNMTYLPREGIYLTLQIPILNSWFSVMYQHNLMYTLQQRILKQLFSRVMPHKNVLL